MDETETYLPIKVLTEDDGEAPTARPITTGDHSEVEIILTPNTNEPGLPEYRFHNSKGKCHKRVDNKDHFGHQLGHYENYRLDFKITNAGRWTFDLHNGPIKFVDRSILGYYAVSDASADSFTLSVYLNPDSTNHLHTFNLFVLDHSTNPPTPGKIDPDVDNPPLGYPFI